MQLNVYEDSIGS